MPAFSRSLPPSLRCATVLLGAFTTLALSGCADQAPATSPGLSLQFASLSAGGCEEHPNGTGNIPADVTTLAAVIEIGNTVSDPQRIAVSGLDSGRWVIGPLPVSESADVVVYGCDATGSVIYEGRSNHSPIPDQAEATVRMFLVPVGKFACTGSKAINAAQGQSNHLSAARSFAAIATLPGGDAVVTGGVGDWEGDTKKGVGSLDTDVYRHDGGHFRRGPALLEKRVWHHAIALDSGKVLVVGGVTSVAAQGALPSPLMAPTDIAVALPKTKAEILNVIPGATGTYEATKAADNVDVGVGAHFMSSAVKVGDSVVFAGGIETNGTAVDKATRLSGLAAIAGGAAGTTQSIDLGLRRIRPALLAFSDGTIVVWGGSTEGTNDAAELGEIIAPGGDVSAPVKITGGPKTLFDDSMLGTFGPAAAVLKSSTDQLIFVVAGGMPRLAPNNATAVPSYLVVLNKDGTAQLKHLDLGGQKLHAGLGAGTATLLSGQALFAGGLIGLSGVAPCDASASECLLSSATLLEPPTTTDGDTVTLSAKAVDLGGKRAGIAIANLPAGVLLAGGQSSAVTGSHSGVDALDPTGRVLAGALSDEQQAKICGK